MVYDKGQLVALAVGGGGAVVAAVVLAYLIRRYRGTTEEAAATAAKDDDDDNDDDEVFSRRAKGDDPSNAVGDALLSSTDHVSRGFTPPSPPSASARTAGDFRLSYELEPPLDFLRLSQSSGIDEVESPSFEELLALEREAEDGAATSSRNDDDDDARRSVGDDDDDEREVRAAVPETRRENRRPPDVAARDRTLVVAAADEEEKVVDEAFEPILDVDSTNGNFNRETETNAGPSSSAAEIHRLPAVVTDNLQRPEPYSTATSSSSDLSPTSRALTLSSGSPSKLSPPSGVSPASPPPPPRSGCASLDDIEEQTTVLSPSESRALVAFLASANTATVRRALPIAANAATFPANRYFLRRAGCIPVLNRFLDPTTNGEDVVEASERALGNLAVDESNLEYMKDSLTLLIANAGGSTGETTTTTTENVSLTIRSEALVCLTNLTRTSLHHRTLLPLVDDLLANVDDGSLRPDLRHSSLQILINLSLSADVSPDILRSRSLSGLSKWLALTPTGKPHQDASRLNFALNVCHLLSNLLETTFGACDDATSSSPPTGEWVDEVVEREETLLGSMASEVRAVVIRSLLFDLNRHAEPDVRFQGKRLYALLAPLWRRCKASAGKAVIVEEET